jgi:hypothetical protein
MVTSPFEIAFVEIGVSATRSFTPLPMQPPAERRVLA